MFIYLLLSLSFVANATTLKESYEAARLNMESIKRAEQGVLQREEQKNRARAGLLPTVNGFANYTRIDPPSAPGFNAFTLTKQYNVGVRLTQPLIRGGVLGALDLAKDNILLAEFQKDATELNLYQLVINAYYNLKIAQNDVKNLQKLLSFSKERVSEIKERAKIGRSRKGELVEAEAQLYTAESQYQVGLIQLSQVEENFEFFTRMKPKTLPELASAPKVEGSLDAYLAKLKSRPDILSARQQVKAADHQVDIAKGSHYPSVDFIGNYYVDRTGILASSEWDAGVVVSVPFYQGGGVVAASREALAAKRVAELTSYETIRVAEREMRIIYQNYQQILLQLSSLQKALAKSEEAYKLNKKDYQYGLVNNLDVLQTLNIYIQTKRSYDNLLVFAHMTYKNLESATGALP
jgi:outer membrane protein TolC